MIRFSDTVCLCFGIKGGGGDFLKVVGGDRGLRGIAFLFDNDKIERNDPSDCMPVAVATSHAACDTKCKRGRILFDPPLVAIMWPLLGFYWRPDSRESARL